MKALVLGSTGFIGGAIARALAARGDEVVSLVRGEARLPFEHAVMRGNLLDPNAIAVAAKGCDAIFHAAGVPMAGADPSVYQWTFVAGTENVLAAARHAGVPRILMISCADVTLANEDRVHWNEKRDVADPPFGARAQALRLAEEIALALSDDAVQVTTLRPGWVWGPGDFASLPRLIEEARHGGIRMFGDGRNLIATTYIDHVVRAALDASRAPLAAHQPYYIGDAEFLELREFAGQLSKALDLPTPRAGVPLSIGWPLSRVSASEADRETMLKRGRSTVFDVMKATADFGYEAGVPIEEGMASLSAWVKEQGGLDALVAKKRPLPSPISVDPSDAHRKNAAHAYAQAVDRS